MTYEAFKEEFLDSIARQMPEGSSIRVDPAPGNGKECVSVVPKGKEESLYPAMEIAGFYTDYLTDGLSTDSLAKAALEVFDDFWKQVPDLHLYLNEAGEEQFFITEKKTPLS